MWFGIVSLFPEMFQSLTEQGVTGRAFTEGKATITFWNPRDYTLDVHRTVDDRPYGGGPGMGMKFEPASAAITAARGVAPDGAPVVCLTPQGRVFDQDTAKRLAALPGIILLAGRYEGIDERLLQSDVDEELSLGDFVLSGGEIAAMAVIDAVVRLLPGVLGDSESAEQDSFMAGLLDHPHYTRPEEVDGARVPAVLLSGDHAAIAHWRRQQRLRRTLSRRPELLDAANLDTDDLAFLETLRHDPE